MTVELSTVHKFVPPIPCTVTAHMGGTDDQRIFVMSMARADNVEDMLMVGW